MSDLDKLEKKYEKGSKAKEIRGSISKLKETPSNPDTKRAFEGRKETLESMIRSAKQATAGFRSQWSGLDDEGKVGMGKGTPGIYYNTMALPALAGVVDEKYAPDFAVAADKKAGKIKEAVRKDMGINEPRGPLEHFSYAGGEMIGQIPVPGAWMNKIVGGVKKLGTTGKIAAAPVEYLTPTVDPRALNYGIGTTFGGTLGTALEEEPNKKDLGGLIQKYENGGKVGKLKKVVQAITGSSKKDPTQAANVAATNEVAAKPKPKKVYYHGTMAKEIDSSKGIQTFDFGHPDNLKFFTPAPEFASEYAGVHVPNWKGAQVNEIEGEPGGSIYPVHIELGKHWDYSTKEGREEIKNFLKEERESTRPTRDPEYKDLKEGYWENIERNYDFLDYLRNKGYDSITMNENGIRNIGVWNTNNIKSVFEEEPTKKALGGLIQKYENGGKVGKVKSFFSAVDKAIDTLKQKKGTGEQILKQLEATPGVKKEELEARGIKQKLQASPKITQEELQKTAKRNKPSIPKRIVLGGGVDSAWQPKLEKHLQEALNELNLQPVVDPATGKNFGFMSDETGDILSRDEIRALSADELGLPVNPESGKIDDPESRRIYMNVRQAVDEADSQFKTALDRTETKFGQYSRSKGKDNYREVLLQHENAEPSNAPALNARLEELLNSQPETEAAAQAINEEINQVIDKLSTRRPFTGTHWSDPDIFAHYRVSDMTGPNGEKILYVDEVQSDWHQKARDSRKQQIKKLLISEKADIDRQALEQLRGEIGNVVLTPDNMNRLKKIELALTKERRFQLEKEVPEDAGYRGAEDNERLDKLNQRMQDIRDVGVTTEDIKEYYTPGKIIGDSSGYDKVLSFNDGSKSPRYQEVYDSRFQQAMNAGVGPEVAANFAKRRADEDLKHDWSVTVIQVDPRTGEPIKTEKPRTHQTSPERLILAQLRNEAETIETKKPDAPFKKNWHELAVRDILDLAANEGYDKVAFSPGIEQVKRYSEAVRNVVDEIEFVPKTDGRVAVTGIKFGNVVFDGQVLGDTFVDGPQKVIGQTLEEVFGSKIGKQIEEQSQVPGAGVGKIAGEDLTIGGEGMKSFYDQRLPSYVKEYGKKEFKAPTSYTEIKGPVTGKAWTPQQFRDEMNRIDNDDSMELMEMVQDMSFTRAEAALASRGRTQSLLGDDYEDELWDEIENQRDSLYDEALRTLAQRNMEAKAGKENAVRAFSIDVTPEMKEKITTQGQRLHGFVAPQILPPLAAGAAGAEYIRQSVQQPPAEPQEPPQEQIQEPPEEPQAFQKGGKVGNMRDAAESLLRVLHGSPTKVRLDKEKNLDVTTDESYAMKRARDKMEMFGQAGPPMLNRFDVPAAKMLRFEETYSPADVALMRRFFRRLPEGQAMTGEEIYDAAGGKDYVMEGIAKAGNMSGYERPAGGSGGVGNWYRVTDQEALTRKARGGFVEGYADGGIKGGKVDLARRGILGLSRLFEEPAQTANLPAVIPTTPVAQNPVAKVPEVTAKPETVSPLTQLIQKTAETPMSRRDVLKRAGQVAIQQVVPMPKIADVIPEIAAPMAPLTQMAADIAQSTFKANPTIDAYISKYVAEMADDAYSNVPNETAQSMWLLSRQYLKDILPESDVKRLDKLAKTPRGRLVPDSADSMSEERAEMLYDEMLTQVQKLKPHEQLDVVENMYQMNGDPAETAEEVARFLDRGNPGIKQEEIEKYISDMYDNAYKKAE